MIQAEFFPCDASFKSPIGGVKVNESFTISIKTNAERAVLVLTKKDESSVPYEMNGCEHGFTLTMSVTTSGLYEYFFELSLGDERTCVYADGSLYAVTGEGKQWQLTAYEERYEVPDTFDGGIIYQIMPDRFAIGKKRFKTKKHILYRDDWGGAPQYEPNEEGIVENFDMFGGNLDGITEKLDYLKELNVKCIYLNPIFEAASNHKYDTGSYNRVDADFGGEDALRRLIKKAKKRGISIILDGVFSHTGADSVYFNKYGNYDGVGAYQSKDSPYYDWYDFEEYPDKYDCWWGVKILPCVKENNESFTEFITGEDGIVRRYLRLGIAGWRLDVADELPDEFLDRLTAAAKTVNPKAMILGEVWEDASNKVSYSKRRRYLTSGQLDSVTDYPLKDAMIAFAARGDAEGLARTVNTLVNNYPKRVLGNLMNMLSTHDTVRVLTVLSDDEPPKTKAERAEKEISDYEKAVKRLRLAAALQYTLPGTPCVYYGDEAGVQGYEDPFNRRCYPWGSENGELVEHYRKLGRLRKMKALRDGGIRITCASSGIFIFERENIVVVANATDAAYPLKGMVKDVLSGEEVSIVPPVDVVIYIKKESKK